MSRKEEQEERFEYVEQYDPIDSIESTHYERERAHDYSSIEADGEYTYSLTRLEALGRVWIQEESNPLRSERSRAEARRISDLLAFEIAYRSGELRKLEENFAWKEKVA